MKHRWWAVRPDSTTALGVDVAPGVFFAAPSGAWASWLINLAVAELLIRRGRRRSTVDSRRAPAGQPA